MSALQLWITRHDCQLSLAAPGGGEAQGTAVSLRIALDTWAGQVLRHAPPTGAEMEQAIMELEDAITPHLTWVQMHHAMPLQVMGDGWAQPLLQQMRTLTPAPTATIWEWEQVFQQLVWRVEGASATSAGIPLDMPLWAAIVLVRELLHHAGFTHVQIG